MERQRKEHLLLHKYLKKRASYVNRGKELEGFYTKLVYLNQLNGMRYGFSTVLRKFKKVFLP